MRVLVEQTLLVHPPAFREMVTECARDGVVGTGMGNRDDKLGDHRAVRRSTNMFAIRPPAEVVGFFQLFVGAIEIRYVGGHPVDRLVVGNGAIGRRFGQRIELANVLREFSWFKNEGLRVPERAANEEAQPTAPAGKEWPMNPKCLQHLHDQ
jgi:hypothetical protein